MGRSDSAKADVLTAIDKAVIAAVDKAVRFMTLLVLHEAGNLASLLALDEPPTFELGIDLTAPLRVMRNCPQRTFVIAMA